MEGNLLKVIRRKLLGDPRRTVAVQQDVERTKQVRARIDAILEDIRLAEKFASGDRE